MGTFGGTNPGKRTMCERLQLMIAWTNRLIAKRLLSTSAKTGAGADPRSALVLAAADLPAVAAEAFLIDSAGPSGSAILSDRRRTCWDGQARHAPRLPDGPAGDVRRSYFPLSPLHWPGTLRSSGSFSPSRDGAQCPIPAPRERVVTRRGDRRPLPRADAARSIAAQLAPGSSRVLPGALSAGVG